MGAISESIARVAKANGVEIVTSASISRILTEGGRATGVELTDGTKVSLIRMESLKP